MHTLERKIVSLKDKERSCYLQPRIRFFFSFTAAPVQYSETLEQTTRHLPSPPYICIYACVCVCVCVCVCNYVLYQSITNKHEDELHKL
jgi:hypothetical protein